MSRQEDSPVPGPIVDHFPPAPPAPISYEQFLDWCDEDTLAEWVDGAIVLTSPASLDHQRIVQFLAWLLQAIVELDDAGVVLVAPFQMKLPAPLRRGREPDILFLARDHADRLRSTFLDGAADLVIEVISPDSEIRDREEKYREYEAARIPEYWLTDPLRRRVEVFHLDATGRYRPIFDGPTGTIESRALPGFRVAADWLWSDPAPRQIDVRRALGLP